MHLCLQHVIVELDMGVEDMDMGVNSMARERVEWNIKSIGTT